MHRNCGGYKIIYPLEDEESEITQEYKLISD